MARPWRPLLPWLVLLQGRLGGLALLGARDAGAAAGEDRGVFLPYPEEITLDAEVEYLFPRMEEDISPPLNVPGTSWDAVGQTQLFSKPFVRELKGWHEGVKDKKGVEGNVMFLAYRRTGYMLSKRFLAAYAKRKDLVALLHRRDNFNTKFGKHGLFWLSYWPGLLHLEKNQAALIVNPMWNLEVPRLKKDRVVHFVRDPVDLVLSSYRAHSNRESVEKWVSVPLAMPEVDEAAHRAVFGPCQGPCSLYDIFKATNASTGVQIEALVDRAAVEVMLEHLRRWKDNPQVLHISIEHFRTNSSMATECVLRFLGETEPSESSSHFAATLLAAQNKHETQVDRMVTKGKYNDGKDNDDKLRHVLEKHPVWGDSFKKIRVEMYEVWKSEHKRYGCPVPKWGA